MTDWNQLFVQWLEDMAHQAELSSAGANHRQATYTRALASLKTATSEGKTYTHASQLVQLKYIGDKICQALEFKAKKYCEENNIPVPQLPSASVSSSRSSHRENSENEEPAPKRRKSSKAYVPRLGSGGYAILMAMGMHEQDPEFSQGMSKSDIIRLATPYSTNSFTSNPSTGVFYSAWTSMKGLQQKELVDSVSSGRLVRYLLTEDGRKIATQLVEASKLSPLRQHSSSNNVQSATVGLGQGSPRSRTGTVLTRQPSAFDAGSLDSPFSIQEWDHGSYQVQLIIDNREVRSRDSRDFFPKQLREKHSINALTEALPVGDALWVVENTHTGKRAVVDYILERKRLDDLVGSIKDGRFTEQKFRLNKSGLEYIIYLLEKPVSMSAGPFSQAIQTALSQSVITNQFYYHKTDSPEATAEYLARVTKFITARLYKRSIHVITPNSLNYKDSVEEAKKSIDGQITAIDWDTFETAMSKSGSLTVKDVFIKMLMTIRGVTFERATLIQRFYATPLLLVQKYASITLAEDKALLFAELTANEIATRKISKQVSTRIYETWGK